MRLVTLNSPGQIMKDIMTKVTEEDARGWGYESRAEFERKWADLLGNDKNRSPRQRKENALVKHYELERKMNFQEVRYANMIRALEEDIVRLERAVRNLEMAVVPGPVAA